MATGGVNAENNVIESLQAVNAKNEQVENLDPNFGSSETEAIILADIRKVHVQGNRANSESITAPIQKKHGLARSATILQIKYLIACGKLVLAYHGWKESLCFPKDPVVKNETL